MKIKPEREILDAMTRNPGNWKGIFYFNRRDPRIIVPKLNPAMGWTLNFASPYTYIGLIAFIVVAILIETFFN